MIFVKYIIFLIIFYIAGIVTFGNKKTEVKLADFPVYVLSGIIVEVIFTMILGLLNLSINLLLIPNLLFLIIFIYYYKRLIIIKKIEIGIWQIALLVLVILVFLTPFIIQFSYAGLGDYPRVFYHYDTSFYLGFVHSFINNFTYPPGTLDNVNYSIAYHHGSMILSFLFSNFGRIAPHISYQILATTTFVLLIIFTAYSLLLKETKSVWLALLGLFVFLFSQIQYFYFNKDIIKYLVNSISDLEYFRYTFPDNPSLAGIAIVFALLYTLLNFDRYEMKVLSVLFVSTIVIFKLPHAPLAGLGYFVFICFKAYERKSIKLFLYSIVSFILMLIFYFLFCKVKPVYSDEIVFCFPNIPQIGSYIELSYFLFPILIIAFIYKEINKAQIKLFLPFIIIFPFIVAFYSFGERNTDQLYYLSKIISPLFFVVYIFSNYEKYGKITKINIALLIVFLVTPLIINNINYSISILNDPAKGYRYVNNDEVADALKHIPVKNTVTVTNDLRYPADNYLIDNRQTQIAAIFGHQCFGNNFRFLADPEKDIKMTLINAIRSNNYNSEIVDKFVKEYKLTHLLIHKEYEHCTNIPLRLIYENEKYAVYLF